MFEQDPKASVDGETMESIFRESASTEKSAEQRKSE